MSVGNSTTFAIYMDLPLLDDYPDVRGCLHHWTGLPGDDRTLVPGAEDQGGVV